MASRNSFTSKHLRLGWWSLLAFLSLGIVLEALHGFKVGLYLDVSNETRRLLWTLAHAHGVLLSLVHIAFALTVERLEDPEAGWQKFASTALSIATLLIPGGFFLGGLVIYDGDPGLGVLLVPVGALLLFIAVFRTAQKHGG